MIDGKPRIGDEVYIHGYIDEIRSDVIIIRNDGGYFGTVPSEMLYYEEDDRGYGTMNSADTPQTDLVEDSPSLVKDLVKAFGEDGTWLERQGVYTLTLAEAKQRAVDIIESVTQTETQNLNLTFEKADEPQTEGVSR